MAQGRTSASFAGAPAKGAGSAVRVDDSSFSVNHKRRISAHGQQSGDPTTLATTEVTSLSGPPQPPALAPHGSAGEDGLVLRVPDPADRRSVRARLTDEGQRLAGEFLREFMTHSLELVEDLPQEDLERVRHVALLLVRRIEARLAPANRNDPSSVAPTRSR